MTSPTRPEPVLHLGQLVAHWQQVTAAVVGVVSAVGTALVTAGLVNGGQVQQWVVVTGTILAAVGTMLGVVLSLLGAQTAKQQAATVRELVTPLEAPRNTDGHALVDAEFYGRHAEPDLSASMGPDLHEAP